MDPDAFLDALEAGHETELSRLGSSKALYAVTGGEMSTGTVLAAMTERASAAAEAFDSWVTDTEHDGAVSTLGEAAEDQRAAAARLEAPTETEVPAPGPLFDHLRGLDGLVDRASGFVAWVLVADATRAQAVGFFVGSADAETADTFRELRDDLERAREQGLALLESVCSDEYEWDRALEVAGATIDAAYDGYVDVLENLGITVKPIC